MLSHVFANLPYLIVCLLLNFNRTQIKSNRVCPANKNADFIKVKSKQSDGLVFSNKAELMFERNLCWCVALCVRCLLQNLLDVN